MKGECIYCGRPVLGQETCIDHRDLVRLDPVLSVVREMRVVIVERNREHGDQVAEHVAAIRETLDQARRNPSYGRPPIR